MDSWPLSKIFFLACQPDIQGPVTLTPVAERLAANEAVTTCLNDLGSSI